MLQLKRLYERASVASEQTKSQNHLHRGLDREYDLVKLIRASELTKSQNLHHVIDRTYVPVEPIRVSEHSERITKCQNQLFHGIDQLYVLVEPCDIDIIRFVNLTNVLFRLLSKVYSSAYDLRVAILEEIYYRQNQGLRHDHSDSVLSLVEYEGDLNGFLASSLSCHTSCP